MTGQETMARARLSRLQGYLAQDPENANLRADLFDAALEAGALDVAREQVDEALRRWPGDLAWEHRGAVLLLATRRYPEAQAAFQALIDRGAEDPAVRHNLAFALFGQGAYEACSEALAPLLDDPGDGAGAAWVLWLRSEYRLHHLDEALDRFRAAAARQAMAPEAWGVASMIALDASRLEEAKEWSARSLAGRPDQLEALAARGSIELVAQDAVAAVASFGRAVQVHPRDGRSWSGLALARMLSTDLAGAGQAFDKAVAYMPEHVGTWIARGWCQLLTNDFEASRRSFQEALDRDRNFAESHGGLAVALIRLGRIDEAKEHIDLAVRLDRGCMSARYANALLTGEAEDPAKLLRLGRKVLAEQRAAFFEKPPGRGAPRA